MSKKIPAYAKNFKNHKVIIVSEDGSLEQKQVYNIDSGTIETEDDMLPISDSIKYYDKTNAGFTYVFNLDVPAKVEAEELKKLRRSSVINNLMNFDREKPLDIFKLMPWLVTIVALIFS